MDLRQHKERLSRYEDLLQEIEALKAAERAPTNAWLLDVQVVLPGIGDYRTGVPIPADYARKTLREFIWGLESQAKDEAAALGLDA